MNKVAIRILMRLLDVLLEQAEEVRYAHKGTAAYIAMNETVGYIRQAKNRLVNLTEYDS